MRPLTADDYHAILADTHALVHDELNRARLVKVEPWFNVASAAAYLDCPKSRIHDLVRLGKLKPHRDGRRLLFRRANLDAILDAG